MRYGEFPFGVPGEGERSRLPGGNRGTGRTNRNRHSARRATHHGQLHANKQQRFRGGPTSVQADRGFATIDYAKLRFKEVKELMERKLAQFKKGVISNEERRKLAES